MATVSIRITRDDITPAFKRLTKMGRDTTPVMRSMGNTFKSITEGNFNAAGAGYRPSAWPAKRDGSPSNLKQSGLLWHSFHLTVTKDTATLANPVRHFVVIVKGVFLKGMPAVDVLHSLWPLAVLAVVTLSAATWLFRRRTE